MVISHNPNIESFCDNAIENQEVMATIAIEARHSLILLRILPKLGLWTRLSGKRGQSHPQTGVKALLVQGVMKIQCY